MSDSEKMTITAADVGVLDLTPTLDAAAVTNEQVYMITHTARIQMVLADTPAHTRKPEYDDVITNRYKGQWRALSPAQRKAVCAAALTIHDMTPAIVAGAVQTLEG